MCALIANALRGKDDKPMQPVDFMPDYARDRRVDAEEALAELAARPRATREQARAAAQELFQALGGR